MVSPILSRSNGEIFKSRRRVGIVPPIPAWLHKSYRQARGRHRGSGSDGCDDCGAESSFAGTSLVTVAFTSMRGFNPAATLD
jgi:hypothetical protein